MNPKTTLRKRIFSVMLTLVMVLSMMPMWAFAAEGSAAEVTAGSTVTTFDTIEQAIEYANGNKGCTLKLLKNVTVAQTEDFDSLPYVTGDFTLDLNGKTIDAVFVGKLSFDADDEVDGCTPGTLTVTGSGSVDSISVNGGALTLKEGTVSALDTGYYSATINIDGGTVEDVSLSSLNSDESIFANISGGSVQALDLIDATVTFTGGNHGSATQRWRVNSGNLNISGGSFENIEFLITGGNINISGGEFGYISTDPQMSSSEYKKPTLGSLLGDGCAFYDADGNIANADVLTLENVRVIADHEHSYKDGKCTTCGAPCNHNGYVNYGDGVCDACGTQLEAEVEYKNGSSYYFTSFQSAIDSIPHGMSEAVTLYLLKDFYCIDDDLYLQNSNNIKLDLNAKVLSGTGKIIVGNRNTLEILGGTSGDIDYDLTIEAAGGDVIIDDSCNDIGNISVTSADSAVTIKSGNAESLSLAFTDTESLKNIKLSGGNFKEIKFTGGDETVAITDMLEAGYAFKDNKGTLCSNAGDLVRYGLSASSKTYFAQLEVVPCDHSAVNEAKGYCNYCGKLYAGKITDKNGSVRYVEELQNDDFGNENTVMLLQDIGIVAPQSNCTIEVNGRLVNMVNFLVQDGTLTLKCYGKIDTVNLGYDDIDSTLVIEQKSFANRIEIGTLSVNKTTKTKLTGGQFDKIQRNDGLYVEDLLADGYSFFDKAWDGPEYISGKTSTSKPYYIYTHDHWFIVNIDGETQCQECGMPCNHTTIGADGKCQDVCKRQIYTAVLTKADGTATNYESFADAWSGAIENEGSTLKLLCNLDLDDENSSGSYLLEATKGSFTLDLNGCTLEGSAQNSIIRITDTADIKIINGKINNKFDGTGGALSRTGANAVRAENGAAVSLDGVEFTPGSDNTQIGTAVYILESGIVINDSTFNGLVMIVRRSGEASVEIGSATLHYGIAFGYVGSEKEYDTVNGFFADGNMLLDKDGKYIDITDESLWASEELGEYKLFNFQYDGDSVITPHTHTYTDGVCSDCGYTCPHNSGNDREAGYFQKAICSQCKAEYGEYKEDTTAPTGEILIKGRPWWQTVLNKISFGLFFKEDVSLIVNADDDSYSEPGFDESKQVKTEYYVSDSVLTEDAVKTLTFGEYTIPVYFSTEGQYVVYVRLTDHAGNVTYIGSDGFEIDKTDPVIEGMENGGHYVFCVQKTITVTEKNIDKVTLDDNDVSLDENGSFALTADSAEHKITVTDKAGNQAAVYVTLYAAHDFDESTNVCRQCGEKAVAIVEKGDITERFVSVDDMFAALNDEKYTDATVTLLEDAKISSAVSLKNNVTLDLNGKTLGSTGSYGIAVRANVEICSNASNANIEAALAVDKNAHLTMGTGIGNVRSLFPMGKLTIYSGNYAMLSSMCTSGEDESFNFYGGSYTSLSLRSADVRTVLAKGYRFENILYENATGTSISNVKVVACEHESFDDNNVCTGCGCERIITVEYDGKISLFDKFDEAVRYAEKNDGSTVTLYQDITLNETTAGSLISGGYKFELLTGKYTIDLNGNALNLNKYDLDVDDSCDLTIADSVGGGKVANGGYGDVRVGVYDNENAKLTVTGGDFIARVKAYSPSALVLKGGSFEYVISMKNADSSPFVYLADGYAFAFKTPVDGKYYANEENVNNDYGELTVKDVTVAPVPLNIDKQPEDLNFYLTSQEGDKYVNFAVTTIGRWWGDNVNVTFEKADGTVIEETAIPSYENVQKGLSAVNFKVSNSGSYRIKLELRGYVLYTNTFTITVAECEHPGYDKNTGKCTRCGCDLAAAVVKDGKTTGYTTFAEALKAAQTEENKNCTLVLLADVSETVAVKSGTFTIDATNALIDGKLNVAKGVELTVNGGVVSGSVICAKGGKLNASKTYFAGTINCVGDGDFKNCHLAGTVSAKGGMKLNSCEITGALSVSSSAEADGCIIAGTVTVNNGGRLKSTGDTYRNTINVKTGGALEIISGICEGKLAAEESSTLTISGGSYKEVEAGNNVDFTINGGKFTNITVNGQHLIDCLAEGKALKDMNIGEVIDGRVGIAGDVQVVDHTHECVWKTSTHEKLCGCGYVEATDTEAPVISGIENNGEYYGPTDFTVTDENDFTVTMDGNTITSENGKYTVEPDNQEHTITATDIAGNTVTYRVKFYKIYNVTLPTGAGYTIVRDTVETTVKHGYAYDFIVEINNGYSKTDDFKVLVNGNKLDELFSDANSASFVIHNVSEDLVITVEGVADITPPDAEIEIRTNKFKSFMNTVTFGLFFKQTQTVTVTAADDGSGISKVEYLLSETAFSDKAAVTGDWSELTLTDGRASFSIEPNNKVYIYIRVTDASGNVQIINSDGVVVYTDSEAVTRAVEFTMLGSNDLSFDVKLNGNTVAALYNGTQQLDSSDYTVSADGTITLKNAYLSTLAAGEYTVRVAYNPMGESYGEGDTPAMTSLKLTVNKARATVKFLPDTFQKTYDGQPMTAPDFTTDSQGAVTVKYKPYGADDSEYITQAPKTAGKYTVGVFVAESNTHNAAFAEQDYTILKKQVTIIDTAVEASKIYDGTTVASITNAGTLSDNYDGENLKIVTGSANYNDKNAGAGKQVTFTGFSLAGSAAENYELVAQPQGTTADITPKALTIVNLKVKTKSYDGKNTAQIDGIPILAGLENGDSLTLVNGTPTFDSVSVGNNIPISFTEFTIVGDSVTVNNYTLVQPTGITASIVEYIADGSEYSVNSNDWINTDFVVNAKEGYKLSLTDTDGGQWVDSLTMSNETADGLITFYVKNTATGAISTAVTEGYKIDKTAPTGQVELNERTAFQSLLNKISFGLFFKDDVNVKLTASDDASGVKSVMYYKSDRVLSDDEVNAITDWVEDSDFNIEANDGEQFIIYVRIEDNAGNIGYLGSDGAEFDTSAPTVDGVQNGGAYYVTKTVTVSDANLDEVTLNGEKVGSTFTLPGNTDATYVIKAVDIAGNVTEYTVTMMPISSISSKIAQITADNVKSSDLDTIKKTKNSLSDIDTAGATDSEKDEINSALKKCGELEERITAVAAEINRLTEGVNSYDTGKATNRDRADIEKIIGDIDVLLSGDNLTESERAELEALRARANALLEGIEADDSNNKTGDRKSPETGAANDLVLWIALLFINGGIITGAAVVDKRKKRSSK